MPFHFVWRHDDAVLLGFEGPVWVAGRVSYPISFPGRKTETRSVTLSSSAREGALEVLTNVRLYLTGADVPIVQGMWPYYGSSLTPARPELDGGFEVSFDGGRSWTRFSKTVGYEQDPSTWILIPKSAIGLGAIDGQIGPFEHAHLLTRFVVPPQATDFKVFDIRLAADADIG